MFQDHMSVLVCSTGDEEIILSLNENKTWLQMRIPSNGMSVVAIYRSKEHCVYNLKPNISFPIIATHTFYTKTFTKKKTFIYLN